MRTIIELPDALHRVLTGRAALRGVTVGELIRDLIEDQLGPPDTAVSAARRRSDPPPVIIPPRGVPIAGLSRDELRRLEDEEDAR